MILSHSAGVVKQCPTRLCCISKFGYDKLTAGEEATIIFRNESF